MALLLVSYAHLGSLVHPVSAVLEDTGCAAQQSELSLLQYGLKRATQDVADEPKKGYLQSDLPYDDHNDLEAFTYARKKAAAAASSSTGDSSTAAEETEEPAPAPAPAKEAAKEATETTSAPKSLLQLEESSTIGKNFHVNTADNATTAAPAEADTTTAPAAVSDKGDGFLEDDLPFDDHNSLEKASYALKSPTAAPVTGGADSNAAAAPAASAETTTAPAETKEEEKEEKKG